MATADASGNPHLVPVCFALEGEQLFTTIDEKPKRGSARALKRIRNITENPRVALLVDRYDEDWSQIGWVMLRGRALVLNDGPLHDHAQALLRARYDQYRLMRLDPLPVIAVRIERVNSWGNLEA